MKKLLLILLLIPNLVFGQPAPHPVLDFAEDIGIDDDGGFYTGDNVEDALQEIGDEITLLDNFNGLIFETIDMTLLSNGTTISLSIEKEGGGDLTLYFSDGFSTFDSTPAASVNLTAGSDISPQTNFIYILQSTKALTVATDKFPHDAEHARIAKAIVQSASTVQSNGGLLVHAHRDHAKDSNDMGHTTLHVGNWIRHQHATWLNGVAQTFTFNSVPTPDEIDLALTSGEILQLHEHTFPTFDTSTGGLVHVVNDSSSAYTTTSDIETLLTDADGDDMTGKYYNLVFWGSVSEKTGDSQVFVNLPTGSYNKEGDATDDVDGETVFDIPDDFRGGAFLISRITIQNSGGGNTFTLIQETDLRGLFPNIVAGGGASAITTEFADNAFKIFDESDVTKIMAFQTSGITTGNTRTYSAPDSDGTLPLLELAQAWTADQSFDEKIIFTGDSNTIDVFLDSINGEDFVFNNTAIVSQKYIFKSEQQDGTTVETDRLILNAPTTQIVLGASEAMTTTLQDSAASSSKTITFPNITGTLMSLAGTQTVTGTKTFSETVTSDKNYVGWGIAPIGSILAWAKTITGVPALPSGWVQCDGQTLDDGDSPLDGEVIPDLNGDNQFMRGNSTSGGTGGSSTHVLSIPELPAHKPTINDAQHKHAPSGIGRFVVNSPDNNEYGTTGLSFKGAVNNNTSMELSNISLNNVGSGFAHENKPPFYNVVWIMRVK